MSVRTEGFALALALIRVAHRIPRAESGFLRCELRLDAIRLGGAVFAPGPSISRRPPRRPQLLFFLGRLETRLLLAAHLGFLDPAALRNLFRSISALRHLLARDTVPFAISRPGGGSSRLDDMVR